MVRFAKPHISVIYTEQWRNMMVLNNQDFIIENLTVRFTIYVFSVIFKNSAAVTNTRPGIQLMTLWGLRFDSRSRHLSFVKRLSTQRCRARESNS